ncbi:GPW/gp25 family protein [Adhaeribacter swui]|uniref:GPW/gp25 family protein n=1 Tax=Adhaeribacter swui TaxID=2086471 RepID=A0A7G7GC30_9BACT|nr:GPW/gp25 family protein [Adhaeribacter swui]QNF34714.1 GPW/gp25 family protein [Adhaeribacter swui]
MDAFFQNFTGNGWKFPVEFDSNSGSVVLLSGEEDIRNSLEVLFSTRVGERLMHARYGSSLSSFLFMPMHKSNLTYLEAVVRDEILFNEPRIVITDIELRLAPDESNRLDIAIAYKITATNNRYNYVYPFYLKEATNLEW